MEHMTTPRQLYSGIFPWVKNWGRSLAVFFSRPSEMAGCKTDFWEAPLKWFHSKARLLTCKKNENWILARVWSLAGNNSCPPWPKKNRCAQNCSNSSARMLIQRGCGSWLVSNHVPRSLAGFYSTSKARSLAGNASCAPLVGWIFLTSIWSGTLHGWISDTSKRKHLHGFTLFFFKLIQLFLKVRDKNYEALRIVII